MATTKKPTAKAASKKAPAKKVATKKLAIPEPNKRGKKLGSLTFDVYENGVHTTGEVSGPTLQKIIQVAHRMMDEIVSESIIAILKEMPKSHTKAPAKKPSPKKK